MKSKLYCVVGSLVCSLVCLPAIGQDEGNSAAAEDVDCGDLSDDAIWVAVCEANLAMDGSLAEVDQAEHSIENDNPARVSFDDLILTRTSWQNEEIFTRLSDEEKYRVIRFFSTGAGNRVFAEWVCNTGLHDRVNADVLFKARKLFHPAAADAAVEAHRLHLRLSGVGNKFAQCDYRNLVTSRMDYKESEAFFDTLNRKP